MNPRHLAPKASALPTALHPDDYFNVVAVVVKHVVSGGFLMGFKTSEMDENAGVSTVPGVGGFVRGGKAYTLPKQARYQLRYTPARYSAALQPDLLSDCPLWFCFGIVTQFFLCVK